MVEIELSTNPPASTGGERTPSLEAGSNPETGGSINEQTAPVIFFDGVCGLCNRFVDFVIRRDRRGTFRFAPLQGETARARLPETDLGDLKTLVLLTHDGTYRKSTAVLRILSRLGGFWRAVAAVLWVVPRPLRDVGYSLVASNRYALFGKKETCRLPNSDERPRFLP